MYPIKNKKNYLERVIYLKNFLFFFGLMETSFIKKNSIITTSSFIKKKIKNKTQILRSPNRHKIAQFHIAKPNYLLNYFVNIKLNNKVKINNEYSLLILTLLFNYCIGMESNLLYIKKIKLKFNSSISIKI